jgi:hypothetical protein
MVSKEKYSIDFNPNKNNLSESPKNLNKINEALIISHKISFSYKGNIFYDNLNDYIKDKRRKSDEFQNFMSHIEEIKNFDSMDKEDLVKIISTFIYNYFQKKIKDSQRNLNNLNNNSNINNLVHVGKKISNDSTRFSTDSESEYNYLNEIKKNKINEFFIKNNKMDNLQNYHDSIYENEFLNVFNLNAEISINEFISKIIKYFNPTYSTFIKTFLLVINFIKRSKGSALKSLFLNTVYFSCFYVASVYDDEDNLLNNDLLKNLFTLDIIKPFCLKIETIKYVNFDIRDTNYNYIKIKQKFKELYSSNNKNKNKDKL